MTLGGHRKKKALKGGHLRKIREKVGHVKCYLHWRRGRGKNLVTGGGSCNFLMTLQKIPQAPPPYLVKNERSLIVEKKKIHFQVTLSLSWTLSFLNNIPKVPERDVLETNKQIETNLN